MALADERGGDVLGAEAQLRMAVSAFAGWEPAVDRLAWYSSDRGDAEEAARLWRSLGVGEDDPRLMEMEVEVLTGAPGLVATTHVGAVPVASTRLAIKERPPWLRCPSECAGWRRNPLAT